MQDYIIERCQKGDGIKDIVKKVRKRTDLDKELANLIVNKVLRKFIKPKKGKGLRVAGGGLRVAGGSLRVPRRKRGRGLGVSGGRKYSWQIHVSNTIKANPNNSFKKNIKLASSTYKQKGKGFIKNVLKRTSPVLKKKRVKKLLRRKYKGILDKVF